MGIESPVHLLFIAVIALVVLGPKRLPALARALGQGIREFRSALEQGAQASEPGSTSAETELEAEVQAEPVAADRLHSPDQGAVVDDRR
jgi:sec-independent protein translocase protein TatA